MTDVSASEFDAREFRQALSSFATGVTIITTRDEANNPVGLTVNSFNSVSLDPPLVLWSLARNSNSLSVFKSASHWAVHILAAEQQELSNQFAKKGADKFAGVETVTGAGEVPLLTGCSARFECKTAFQYEGGDHEIFVGEVLGFERCDSAPLVFHAGSYAHATRRPLDEQMPSGSAWLDGSFNEGFLGYLLGRSHFEFFARLRPLLQREQLTDDEFYLLSSLTLQRRLTAEALAQALHAIPETMREAAIVRLEHRKLVVREQEQDGTVELTQAGAACALRLISEAKAIESQIIDKLGQGETTALKSLLNRLLHELDPEVEKLWNHSEV